MTVTGKGKGQGQGSTNGKESFPPNLLHHLRQSGLTPNTINLAHFRLANKQELPTSHTTANTQAIYIPYHHADGQVIEGFYRLRFVPPLTSTQGKPIRYSQPPDSLVHAYLPPPPIVDTTVWQNTSQPLIITEGEKKALAASQFGFPTIGLGGVDSWRTRRIVVRTESVKQRNQKQTQVTFKSNAEAERLTSKVAPELLDVEWSFRTVYLIFDTPDVATNPNVQRSLFELALWLEDQGANPLQVILPDLDPPHKIGLDDFLDREGPDDLRSLIETNPHSFPVPPDAKRWIQRQLDQPSAKRPVYRRVARAVIASLDQHGARYVDQSRTYFYFDRRTKVLHDFHLGSNDIRQARLSTLGTLLHDEFGIDTSDAVAVTRIADYFTAQPPIDHVVPHRVVSTYGDTAYFQLNDSELVKIDADDIEIVDNGDSGQLFVAGQVEPASTPTLQHLLSSSPFQVRGLWVEALGQTNLEPFDTLTLEQSQILLSCLFHLNPWLRRWRGLMLPLEMAVAEPNSGKTFLYNLRRGILTGRPSLDNVPTDLRDWFASLSSAPALWVADNLADLPRDLRGRMSDELARLITDPDPSVDMRQLFTTNTVLRVPINCSFAATAVWNPFFKPDLVQRTLTLRLRAIPAGKRNSTWYQQQLARREEWLVEHFVALHRFFRLVKRYWNPRYLSGHRLQHYEQSIFLMGQALGHSPDTMLTIVNQMQTITQEAVANADPVIAAIRVYVQEKLTDYEPRRIQDIVEWVKWDQEERFVSLTPLRNAVRLGHYISQHKSDIENTSGVEIFRRNNASYIRKRK